MLLFSLLLYLFIHLFIVVAVYFRFVAMAAGYFECNSIYV